MMITEDGGGRGGTGERSELVPPRSTGRQPGRRGQAWRGNLRTCSTSARDEAEALLKSLMENSAVWGTPGYEDVPEIRVFPYAGLTKNGREEIYGLLDELLEEKGLSD